MPSSNTPTTLHTHVSVMQCDCEATLEEALLTLAPLGLHLERVGPASIAFPSSELDAVQRAFQAQACYPRVIGRAPRQHTPPDDA